MAKAYRCDICGQFYNGYNHLYANNEPCEWNSLSIRQKFHNDEVNKLRTYDVCPSCKKKISSLIASMAEDYGATKSEFEKSIADAEEKISVLG